MHQNQHALRLTKDFQTNLTTAKFTLDTFETDPNDDNLLENFLRNTEHLDNQHVMAQLQTDKENQMIPKVVNSTNMQPIPKSKLPKYYSKL